MGGLKVSGRVRSYWKGQKLVGGLQVSGIEREWEGEEGSGRVRKGL